VVDRGGCSRSRRLGRSNLRFSAQRPAGTPHQRIFARMIELLQTAATDDELACHPKAYLEPRAMSPIVASAGAGANGTSPRFRASALLRRGVSRDLRSSYARQQACGAADATLVQGVDASMSSPRRAIRA
jgi:hypothetical protein